MININPLTADVQYIKPIIIVYEGNTGKYLTLTQYFLSLRGKY